MVSCRDVELLVQDYLDGYLLPNQREVLEAHVRSCDSCRSLIADITRIDDRLENLEEVEVPAGLARTILDALPPQAYAVSPVRRALSYVAVPALAVLLLGLAFLLKGRHITNLMTGVRRVEVTFSAPYANSVAVVGDFNGWDPNRNRMVRATHEGMWRTVLQLPPGTYQYSLVIDGTIWTTNPLAEKSLADGFGGENSVLIING